MTAQTAKAFYDPEKTYDDNFDDGPTRVPGDENVYKNQGEPSYIFLGKKLYSPFGIPAGPLLNSNYIRYAFEQGFDILCYKTQRSIPFTCNDFPNVLFLDIDGDLTLEKAATPVVGRRQSDKPANERSITNSFGNPSRGPDFWVPDLKKALAYQGPGQLLIMSVVGTIQTGFTAEDYYDDFATTAGLAAATGIEAIEINLSCPNVATEGILCYTPSAVLAICKRVKERIGGTPLIAKIGYFSPDQQGLLEEVVGNMAPYVSAISAINTLTAQIVDENGEQALPGPNRLKSGVCGLSIQWAGLDMVSRLTAIRQKLGLDYEIIGVGGVTDVSDYEKYRTIGADVVQSATAAMWDPQLAAEIKASL